MNCETTELLSTSLLRSLTRSTISTLSSPCHCGVHWMTCLALLSFLCLSVSSVWSHSWFVSKQMNDFNKFYNKDHSLVLHYTVFLISFVHSRSSSFLSWWRTQRPVGDSGHPVSVRHQEQHTEEITMKDRRSELLDLPGLYGRRGRRSSPLS